MKPDRARRGVLLAWLAALAGCASTFVGGFDPALFPRTATAAPANLPGRVALLTRPQVQDLVHEAAHGPAARMRLPVGRITEEALLAALRERLLGGAQRVSEAPHAGAGFAATLVLETIRIEHDDQLAWMIPIPVFPYVMANRNVYARFGFDLSLLDARGQGVWTRSYDSGRELWKRPSFWSNETLATGLLRMAHEAAFRLAGQAALELQQWLAAERNRVRTL